MSRSSGRISFEQLVALAEGQVPPEERDALLALANANPEDGATLAWLTRVLSLMRADTALDAPPEVIARAVRLARPLAPPRAPGMREQIVAALRFDSRKQPAFGIRSGFSSTQQLLYSAGERELDLRLSPADGVWRIAGQVLGPNEAGSVVLESAGNTVSAPLNEQAEFMLPPVPAGNYRLVVALESADIAIEALAVGA